MSDIWFGPNVASDLRSLADAPDTWVPYCSTIQPFIRQILTDTAEEAAINKVGLNNWALLSELLPRFRDMGLKIAVEGYGPKPGACDGTIHADGWKRTIERLNSIGVTLYEAVLDEPLMTIAHYVEGHCDLTIDQLIEPICTVIRAIRSAGVDRVSIVEAFTGRPTNDYDSIVKMMEGVQQAGCSPSALHIDVDGNVVSASHFNSSLADLLGACERWKIPSGVIVIGRNQPKTDEQYVASASVYAKQIPGLFGRWPDRAIVESWVEQPGTFTMPHNLPADPSSHVALLQAVNELSRA